jgi:hypothetical protein
MKIHFIREQDGPVERELKAELSELFGKNRAIQAAYLELADYQDGTEPNVVLCLRSDRDRSHDSQVVGQIERIFEEMFSFTEHLDVSFIDASTEIRLQQVCKPFYSEASS